MRVFRNKVRSNPLGDGLRGWLPETEQPKLIERVKPWVEMAQGLATIIAIAGGGYWFYLQRSTKPLVRLDQVVTQRPLVGDNRKVLLVLDIHTTNIGKTKVELQKGHLDLAEINPAAEGVLWERDLPPVTLEPGENDQALLIALPIDLSIKTLQIHAIYPVPGSKMYWNLLTAVDIGPDAEKRQVNTATK